MKSSLVSNSILRPVYSSNGIAYQLNNQQDMFYRQLPNQNYSYVDPSIYSPTMVYRGNNLRNMRLINLPEGQFNDQVQGAGVSLIEYC